MQHMADPTSKAPRQSRSSTASPVDASTGDGDTASNDESTGTVADGSVSSAPLTGGSSDAGTIQATDLTPASSTASTANSEESSDDEPQEPVVDEKQQDPANQTFTRQQVEVDGALLIGEPQFAIAGALALDDRNRESAGTERLEQYTRTELAELVKAFYDYKPGDDADNTKGTD